MFGKGPSWTCINSGGMSFSCSPMIHIGSEEMKTSKTSEIIQIIENVLIERVGNEKAVISSNFEVKEKGSCPE